jgi:hypothetical protein
VAVRCVSDLLERRNWVFAFADARAGSPSLTETTSGRQRLSHLLGEKSRPASYFGSGRFRLSCMQIPHQSCRLA